MSLAETFASHKFSFSVQFNYINCCKFLKMANAKLSISPQQSITMLHDPIFSETFAFPNLVFLCNIIFIRSGLQASEGGGGGGGLSYITKEILYLYIK